MRIHEISPTEKDKYPTTLDTEMSYASLIEQYVHSKKVAERRPNLAEFTAQPGFTEDIQSLIPYRDVFEKTNNQSPEGKFQSEIFEAALVEEDEVLFGKGVVAIPTTPYDDIKRSTDIVLEIPRPNGVVRVAVDATVSDEQDYVTKKVVSIQENIKRTVFSLKYFASQLEPTLRGELRNIPRVVIGVDRGNWRTLMEALTHTDTTPKKDVALAVLTMIRAQLENEFLYTVSTSKLKTNRNREDENIPDRRTINIAKNFCEKAKAIALQKEPIEAIAELVNYFKKHTDFIEDVSFPDRFALGTNIVAALEWANERIRALKESVTSGAEEQKAAPFTEAAPIHHLVERWTPDTFSSWPVIVGESHHLKLRRSPLQPIPPSNAL